MELTTSILEENGFERWTARSKRYGGLGHAVALVSSRVYSLGLISQLQDAVTTAHETTTEFNDEIIKEHNIFELSKQQEMKEMLGSYADGHIDFYRKVSMARDMKAV